MNTLLAPLKTAALSLLLIAGLAACNTDNVDTDTRDADAPQDTSRPSATTAPAPAQPQEQYAEGELRTVDLTGRTFVLRDATGIEQTFAYTETTRVLGIPNTQGLTGKQGSRARVGYVRQGETNSANWIEILTATPAQK